MNEAEQEFLDWLNEVFPVTECFSEVEKRIRFLHESGRRAGLQEAAEICEKQASDNESSFEVSTAQMDCYHLISALNQTPK